MTKQLGTITQIVGVVVDAAFEDNIPAINDALTVEHDGGMLTLEVAQHLTKKTVRAIALASTDGLKRGQEVVATGAPISVPVGSETVGRMFNVTGDPIDGKAAPKGVIRLQSTALLRALKNNRTRLKFLRQVLNLST